MKRIYLMIMILPILSGCYRHTNGQSIGYIKDVEIGILWNKVYLSNDLGWPAVSCLLIDKNNDQLRDDLIDGRLSFKRFMFETSTHLFTLSKNCSKDEVIKFSQM